MLSPPGDPLEALRLRRGERVLWQGRPGLRLGVGRENWRRTLAVTALLLGAVFFASLAPALEGEVRWSRALQTGASWIVTLLPLTLWIGALWWVRRVSGAGGCVISLLGICVPLVVGAWLFQAVSQPKGLPKLLLHPLFLVSAGSSCLCAASVARSLMSEQGARYFVTSRRAVEVRHQGGEWRIAWSSRFKRSKRLVIQAEVEEGSEVGDLRVGRGRRFLRLSQPATVEADLLRAIPEAAEEEAPLAPEPKASLADALPVGPPATIALPSELRGAVQLREGEGVLWSGRPGLRLPTREIRSLLRGSLSVAGFMFAGWLILLAPALAALDSAEGLILLAVVALWVGGLVGFVSLTLVVQRVVAGGALASGAFLFSAGVLSLALLEAISRGRIGALALDPTAQFVALIGALGLGWILREIVALRRRRYLLTTRRAAALRDGGRGLLWSVALSGDLRAVRSIYPSESKVRGHVVFGFGQVRHEFRFVPGVEDVVTLARQAIRERREAFPAEFELLDEEPESELDEGGELEGGPEGAPGGELKAEAETEAPPAITSEAAADPEGEPGVEELGAEPEPQAGPSAADAGAAPGAPSN